jgi:signal transduction histidine kinase
VVSTELESLLRVSRAVAHGDDLRATLDSVAREAADVADATSASILLRRNTGPGRERPFELIGAHRLGSAYRSAIEHPNPLRYDSQGPSFLAMELDEQMVVEDTLTDARYGPWRSVARREGYRGFVSTPLHAGDGRVIGSLDVYRAAAGPWANEQLQLLALFVRHAAFALEAARLIDEQRQQLHALRRVVRTFEEQSHEHSNRLHTIAGLLAIGEHKHARQLVAGLQSAREADGRRIAERIGEPTIRGLLTAQTTIAEQRGLSLRLTDRSRLDQLPPTLNEATAVTILGNLLDNAFDAVATLPRERRRVVVSFLQRKDDSVWRVRDFGPGIPAEVVEHLFARGVSGKPRHAGLGLHLVAQAVAQAGGRIAMRRLDPGTSFTITLPLGE